MAGGLHARHCHAFLVFFFFLSCPRPTVGGITASSASLPACLHVCLSVSVTRLLILSRSLDGDLRALPFHTHSLGGSTILYPHANAISGDISLRIYGAAACVLAACMHIWILLVFFPVP